MNECPKKHDSYCYKVDGIVTAKNCRECQGDSSKLSHLSLSALMPADKVPIARAMMICAECPEKCKIISPCQLRQKENLPICPLNKWQLGDARNIAVDKVSIIITSRNEKYLNPTLKSLLEMAVGPVEIVVVLDGPEFEPVISDQRIKIIRHSEPQGRRPSINEAVGIADGKYLLHVDGHVTPEVRGYDTILKHACRDNKTMVVCNLTALEPETWTTRGKGMGHKYITHKMKDSWSPVKPRADIEDTICGNGMGWFLERDYFLAFGGCDRDLSDVWGSFGLEWALKVWLSDPDGRGPGRVVLARQAKIAHMWQKKLPYKTPGADSNRGKLRKWVEGCGKNQVRPFVFLEDRFKHIIPDTTDPDKRPLLLRSPDVTVIMNTNGLYPEFIEEAIESFNRQRYPYKHLHIFNTNPHGLKIAEKPDNITISNIPAPESFPCQLANAIKSVKTDYWTVMDSDDIYFSHHLQQLVDGLKIVPDSVKDKPHYVIVPKALQQENGKPPIIRHRGWWSCLYSKVDQALVDQALSSFRAKSQKDTGFDLHFIKKPWWNKFEIPDTRISVLQRLGVAFHIRRSHHNPNHYAEGVERAQQFKPPVLQPKWRHDYQIIHREDKTINIYINRHLGDLVCAEPAIRQIKGKYPEHQINLFSNYPELFSGHPALASSQHSDICQQKDYSLNIYRPTHITQWLLKDAGLPLPERLDEPKLHIPAVNIDKFAIDWNKPTVCICVWTHAIHKRWEKERWKELVERLHYEGYQTILLGTQYRAIPVIHNLSKKTTILEAAEILKRSECMIAIDQGLSHLATAVGTRTVTLFGPAAPEGVAHASTVPVYARSCRDCHIKTRIGRKCPKTRTDCMADITVDMVWRAFEQANSSDNLARAAGYADYFDYLVKSGRTSPDTHQKYGQFHKDYARFIATVLGAQGMKVLDIGCAYGAMLKGFVEKGDIDAYGCDVSETAINGTAFHKKRHRMACIDTSELTRHYGHESFDVLHSQQVFEHFPSKAYSIKVISECQKVLRPKGLFFVAMVTGDNLSAGQLRSGDHRQEDITHINIRPRKFWQDAFEGFGFIDVTNDYMPAIQSWKSPSGFSFWEKYRWSLFVFQKLG